MNFDWFIIIDIIGVPVGILMIVTPNKFYAFLNRGTGIEPPDSWPVTSRVLGALFLLASAFFLWRRFVP